jgi:hypothetical protein
MSSRLPPPVPLHAAVLAGLLSVLPGCGFERLEAPLPLAFSGFTLADLEDIQGDERLTNDQRRDQIRAAIGAPLTPEGDRLVEFLLNFNVP